MGVNDTVSRDSTGPNRGRTGLDEFQNSDITGLPRFGSVPERFGKTAVREIRFESVQGFGGSVRFSTNQIASLFGSVRFGSGEQLENRVAAT